MRREHFELKNVGLCTYAIFHINGNQMTSPVQFNTYVRALEWFNNWLSSFTPEQS